MNFIKQLLLAALVCLPAVNAGASNTGIITGTITQIQSGEPIEGATVTVKVYGATMSAMTDGEGRFTVTDVAIGRGSIIITAEGYQTLEVSGVQIPADQASCQNHGLEPEVEGQATVKRISARESFVRRDRSNSLVTITRDDLRAWPVRSLREAIAIQNGVVDNRSNTDQLQRYFAGAPSRTAQNLHIRGGGANQAGYMLNGVDIRDQFTGELTATVSPHAISSADFHPGAFGAKYGFATSGMINIATPPGTAEYSGMIETISDNFGGSGYDQNWYTGRLSGPLPFLPRGFFSGVVERRWFGDRTPSAITRDLPNINLDRLPGNWLDGWSYHGRADYYVRPDLSLTLTADGSRDEWSRYLHKYLFNFEHTPYYLDENLALAGKLTHKVSSQVSYSLGVSFFESERFRGDGVHREDLWAYGRTSGNPQTDTESLFASWDDPSTPVETSTIWVVTDTNVTLDSTVGDVQFTTSTPSDSAQVTFIDGGTNVGGVGARGDEGHVWDDYLKHNSSYISFSGKVEGRFFERHTLLAGIEYRRHTVRSYQHLFPQFVWRGMPQGFQDVNCYGYNPFGNESEGSSWRDEPKHPTDIALCLQDQIELQNLIITAGLRLDHYDYNALRLRNSELSLDPDSLKFDTDNTNDAGFLSLELADLEDAPSYTQLTPRLGLAVPINNRLQLHANYGIYYQRPPFQYLYSGWDFVEYQLGGLPTYFTFWGNTDLRPVRVTTYEMGLSGQWGKNVSAEISVFHRDEVDQICLVTLPATPTSYTTYRNYDNSTTKGAEFRFRANLIRHLNLDLRYTHASTKSTGSSFWRQRNVAWVNGVRPKMLAPQQFDQRHKIVGVIGLGLGPGEGPQVGAIRPFQNLNLNILTTITSGLPYTPVTVTNEAVSGAVAPAPIGPRNSENRPWAFSIDLKLEKRFAIAGLELAPFLWVKNLLDRDNVADVWGGTGEPNTTGWLETAEGQMFIQRNATPNDNSGLNGLQKYEIAQHHPQNYANPRQVYFGLRASF